MKCCSCNAAASDCNEAATCTPDSGASAAPGAPAGSASLCSRCITRKQHEVTQHARSRAAAMKSLFYTAWEALTLGLAAHGRAYGHMPMVEVGAAGPASTSSKPVSLPPEKDSTRRGVAAARTGRALGWLVTSILLADGASNLWFPGLTAREMIADGFPSSLSTPLGLIILTCAAVFALPRTRVIVDVPGNGVSLLSLAARQGA